MIESDLINQEDKAMTQQNHIKIQVDDKNLDFIQAKDIAKQKAKTICADPMLLSWYQGKTGESYPKFECGSRDKPPWVVFAEARGGDLVIDINQGEFIFMYLSLP